MSLVDDFARICEEFGGEFSEEEVYYGRRGYVCDFIEGHDDFVAVANWMKKKLLGKSTGLFEAVNHGSTYDGGDFKEIFTVDDGEGVFESVVEKTLVSYDGIPDWLRDEFDLSSEELDKVDLLEAYNKAAEAVRGIEFETVFRQRGIPRYILDRGSVECEAEGNWDYDIELLRCSVTVDVLEGAHLPSIIDDVDKAVDTAVEEASDKWHGVFHEYAEKQVREVKYA